MSAPWKSIAVASFIFANSYGIYNVMNTSPFDLPKANVEVTRSLAATADEVEIVEEVTLEEETQLALENFDALIEKVGQLEADSSKDGLKLEDAKKLRDENLADIKKSLEVQVEDIKKLIVKVKASEMEDKENSIRLLKSRLESSETLLSDVTRIISDRIVALENAAQVEELKREICERDKKVSKLTEEMDEFSDLVTRAIDRISGLDLDELKEKIAEEEKEKKAKKGETEEEKEERERKERIDAMIDSMMFSSNSFGFPSFGMNPYMGMGHMSYGLQETLNFGMGNSLPNYMSSPFFAANSASSIFDRYSSGNFGFDRFLNIGNAENVNINNYNYGSMLGQRNPATGSSFLDLSQRPQGITNFGSHKPIYLNAEELPLK
jgi:hypothetical protein